MESSRGSEPDLRTWLIVNGFGAEALAKVDRWSSPTRRRSGELRRTRSRTRVTPERGPLKALHRTQSALKNSGKEEKWNGDEFSGDRSEPAVRDSFKGEAPADKSSNIFESEGLTTGVTAHLDAERNLDWLSSNKGALSRRRFDASRVSLRQTSDVAGLEDPTFSATTRSYGTSPALHRSSESDWVSTDPRHLLHLQTLEREAKEKDMAIRRLNAALKSKERVHEVSCVVLCDSFVRLLNLKKLLKDLKIQRMFAVVGWS